jgi:CcmD family protein
MNSVKYLYAAYIATWLIHGVYLGSLGRRYDRLRRRMKDLRKSARHPASGFRFSASR